MARLEVTLSSALLLLSSCSSESAAPSPKWGGKAPPPPTARMVSAPSPTPVANICSMRAVSVEPPAADPEASRGFRESFGGPTAALGAASDPPRVTKMALESTALGEATGMKAKGPALAATLKEGERAAAPVSIGAGECVTFIAQGGLGAVEVDMFLTEAVSSPPRVAAEDKGVGPIAVIGGREGCFRAPTGGGGLTGELHVRMRRGAGVVLVQEYRPL